MDLNETLFTRMLVKPYREGTDEEKWRAAEEVTVTKEANGYALWYAGDIHPPRIIAWGSWKNDILSYAAHVDRGTARRHAQDHFVLYTIPRLFDLAIDPATEK